MEAFHVTATGLATFFTREQCERYLLQETTRKRKGEEEKRVITPLMQAQFDKGNDWEEKICQKIEIDGNLIRCPFLDYSESQQADEWSRNIVRGISSELNSLLDKFEQVYIHGSLFLTYNDYYENNSIDSNKIYISIAKPDFLLITRTPDENNEGKFILNILVIDAKASSHLKISHQIQVSFYGSLLETVVEKSIDSLYSKCEINHIGGIWLPDKIIDGERIVGDITYFHRSIFNNVLKKLFNTLESLHGKNPKDTIWYFSPKCSMCEFKSTCKEDTINYKKLGMIPGLPSSTQSWMNTLTPNNDTELDIEELHKLVQPGESLNLHSPSLYSSEKRKLYNILNLKEDGSSPVISTAQNQFLGFKQKCSILMPYKPADIQVFLFTMLNPLTERICCLSTLVQETSTNDIKIHSQTCNFDISHFQEEFIVELRNVLKWIDSHDSKPTVSFFVESIVTKNMILQFLVDITLSDSPIARDAEEVYIRLVDDASCLYLDKQPDLWKIDDSIVGPRLIVIQEVVNDLFAVPTPGYLDFESYYPILSKSKESIPSHDDIFDSIQKQDIKKAKEYLSKRSIALKDCVFGIRERSFDYCAETGDFPTEYLCTLPSPPADVSMLEYSHPIIRMIVFISQYELILERQEYLEQRALGPEAVAMVHIQIGEYDSETKTITCIVLEGTELLSDSGGNTFYNWIGVKKESLLELCKLNDFKFMGDFYKFKKPQIPIEGISIVNVVSFNIGDGKTIPTTISIESKGNKWNKGEQILLVPRVVNFNAKKINDKAKTLTSLLEKNKTSEFVDIIENPVEWSKRPLENITNDIGIRKEKVLNKVYKDASSLATNREDDGYPLCVKQLNFLRSQREAFQLALSTKLSLIWGPPGTGKTHFLALATLRFIEIAAAEKLPMRVLCTAYTNTAIDKLLSKINELLVYSKIVYRDIPEKGEWINRISVSRITSENSKRVKESENGFDIIGSTCWQMKKLSAKLRFDVIIVDEGSQLPVSAAMLFLDLLTPGGRLIVAGDHYQLGPVLRGKYPSIEESKYAVQGSLLEALLRTKDGNSISADVLPFMQSEDLANTVMLYENNRMNQSLNKFTQRLYNRKYSSSNPSKSLYLKKKEQIIEQASRTCKEILIPTIYDKKASFATITLEMTKTRSLSLSKEFQLKYEANLIERLVDSFLYLSDPELIEDIKIFIVVPHRAQRTSLQQLFKQEKYNHKNIFADTVDRMQGQEADIVIVSYIFFDPLQVASEAEFLFDRRRINVSISRAERFCLFIGTQSIISPPVEVLANPSSSLAYQHLKSFIDECEKENVLFPLKTTLNRESGVFDNLIENE